MCSSSPTLVTFEASNNDERGGLVGPESDFSWSFAWNDESISFLLEIDVASSTNSISSRRLHNAEMGLILIFSFFKHCRTERPLVFYRERKRKRRGPAAAWYWYRRIALFLFGLLWDWGREMRICVGVTWGLIYWWVVVAYHTQRTHLSYKISFLLSFSNVLYSLAFLLILFL